MTDTPWRARQFMGGYSAEWLPPGQRTFRIIKAKGQAVVFASFPAALRAAQDAFLKASSPEIRATLPIDPARLKSKLEAEAEGWLKVRRGSSDTIYRPGKRPILTLKGTA